MPARKDNNKKPTQKAPSVSAKAKAARSSRRRKPPVPAPEPEPLTPEEIEHFRQLLLERRAELLGNVDQMNGAALSNNRQDSAGDLSSMPIHMADVGTDNYEQEFTLNLIESERKMLRDIDHALQKITEGTYGVCEGTGKPISRTRLEARPEARYCIEYARLIEQGLAQPVQSEQAAEAGRQE